MNEEIKIGFLIENDDIPEGYKTFNLYIKGNAWKFSINLNIYFLENSLPAIKKMFELIYKSEHAPKGFGICKMALDYLLSVCDNEIEYKKERARIAKIFKYIEKYEAYYHLFTEGR